MYVTIMISGMECLLWILVMSWYLSEMTVVILVNFIILSVIQYSSE